MPDTAGGDGPVHPLYLEFDGRLFVVEDADTGELRLPLADEVPFPVEHQLTVHLPSGTVVKAKPDPPGRPTDWPWKDDLPGRDNVDPLVVEAIHRTMSRMVAKVAYVRDGRVLMVKPLVGFFRGTWSLPGGYVDHGEHPRASVVRETAEEIGVRAEVVELLGMESALLDGKGLHFVMFLFRGRLLDDEFAPEPEEIEAVRWFDVDKALEVMPPSMSRGLLADAVERGALDGG